MVLGGFDGVPGVVCEFEGLGVIPGTVPDPLTAEHGGRLPGFCAPGVDPGFVEPGVVAPGGVVPGVVGVPGWVVPGVEGDPGPEGDEGDVCDGLDCPGAYS